MERTKQPITKHVLAILTGDWHLREDTPKCRTDNFLEAQTEKLRFIGALQRQYDCFVLHSGDLFCHWKPSPSLLSYTIENLPEEFITVYGNHDLPQWSLARCEESGVHTLEVAEKLKVLGGVSWGQPMNDIGYLYAMITERGKILNYRIIHTMTYKGAPPFPGCKDLDDSGVLKANPTPDLLLTGHNHIPFVSEMITERGDSHILVNPGGITRQTADQQSHTPRVYLWYSDNTVEPVYLPIEEGVVSRSHIEIQKEKDRRYEAFVSRLREDMDWGLSFRQNLIEFFDNHSTSRLVQDLIWRCYPDEEE